MTSAGETLMAVLAWFAAIALGIWVFWRVARVATGLSRSADPGVPLFESEDYPTETRFVRLAGTDGLNPDGTPRQELLRHCVVGEPLWLELQPATHNGPERVLVVLDDGGPLGWLDDTAAPAVAACLHKGRHVEVAVADVSGRIGLPWGRTLTVKITLEVTPRGAGPWHGLPPAAS